MLFREGIGRTDFPDGDFAGLAAGIRRHLYSLPDATIVYPGHGGPTTVGHEKRHNPFVAAAASRELTISAIAAEDATMLSPADIAEHEAPPVRTGSSRSPLCRAAGLSLAALARLLSGASVRWIASQPDTCQRVYFANHTSHLDALVVWSSLPQSDPRADQAGGGQGLLVAGHRAAAGSPRRSSTRSSSTAPTSRCTRAPST